jgi:hypothetical protein
MKKMSNVRLDDLWLAGFLVAQGARLKTVAVVPYSNGRMQAFFELEDIPAEALEAYGAGDPKVSVHALREALHDLREAMHEALSKRNGNGSNQRPKPNHQTRSGNHEQDSPGNHRSDQNNNRSGGLHSAARQIR